MGIGMYSNMLHFKRANRYRRKNLNYCIKFFFYCIVGLQKIELNLTWTGKKSWHQGSFFNSPLLRFICHLCKNICIVFLVNLRSGSLGNWIKKVGTMNEKIYKSFLVTLLMYVCRWSKFCDIIVFLFKSQ